MNENTKKSGKMNIRIEKGRLFGMFFVVLTFFMLFSNWFKPSSSYIKGISFGILKSGVGEVGACFGIAKVFAIITIVVAALYFVSLLVNFKKFVPALANFKFGFDRLFGLVYYGLFCFSILFNIIGCIAEESAVPTVSNIFLFIFIICMVLVYAIPGLAKAVSNKFNLIVE